MRIVMTGGGSGGHITPILAVATEIKRRHPDHRIIYIGQKGDVFGDIVAEHGIIDEVHTISAGKFRRYHGEGWRQLLDLETMRLNIRDMARAAWGILQALVLMRRLRPDVLFCKGGFVGVPVGLAAAIWRVPYVTHDSDAIPGLANRIIARWASRHAVALDPGLYPYPLARTTNVGVPVSENYGLVDEPARQMARQRIGLQWADQLLLVTGGGLGAGRLNDAMLGCVSTLLQQFPGLVIVHTTGKAHEENVSSAYTKRLPADARRRVIVRDYLTDLHAYSAASDVVVARGGATNFAELAAQGKPAIIVPNPLLTGGHQLKNAEAYAAKRAAVVVSEEDLQHPEVLAQAIARLLQYPDDRAELSRNIHAFTRPDAARDLADIIVELGAMKT